MYLAKLSLPSFDAMSAQEKGIILGIIVVLTILLLITISLIFKDLKHKNKVNSDHKNATIKKPINVEPVAAPAQVPAQTNIEAITDKLAEATKQERTFTSFEKNQEEDAVISYKELLKVAGKDIEATNNGFMPIPETKPEVIETLEVDMAPKAIPSATAAPRFKVSESISPIYGKVNEEQKEMTIPVNASEGENLLSMLKEFRQETDKTK